MSFTDHIKKAEGKLSRRLDEVARQGRFLRPAGAMMQQSLRAKALGDRVFESWLRAWRLPVASDLSALSGQIEALNRRRDGLEQSPKDPS